VNVTGFRIYDVLQYGVDGTGSQDQTLALRSIIKLAEAAGGGAIYFPGGTYPVMVQATDKAHFCLQIAGDNIWLIGDGAASVITNIGRHGDTIRFDPKSPWNNCGIRDLNFITSARRGIHTSEIRAPSFNNLHISRCSFSAINSHMHNCIRLGNLESVSSVANISEISATNFDTFLYMVRLSTGRIGSCSTDAAVKSANTVIIEGGCEDISLAECGFISTPKTDLGSGYCMQIRAQDYSVAPVRCQVSQVYFDSHGYGVLADAGQDMTFTNCWFSDRPGHGVWIRSADSICDSWTFAQCLFANCGAHGALLDSGVNLGFVDCEFFSNSASQGGGNGLTLTNNFTGGVRIIGCRSYNSTRYGGGFGGQQAFGVSIGNSCNNFVVVGNDLRGNSTGGLFLGSPLGVNQVRSNNILQ
jgi:hypothetical protein